VSFYCTLSFTYCMANPTPFSCLIFWSIGVCSILYHNSHLKFYLAIWPLR
jgi:hypothetical protein